MKKLLLLITTLFSFSVVNASQYNVIVEGVSLNVGGVEQDVTAVYDSISNTLTVDDKYYKQVGLVGWKPFYYSVGDDLACSAVREKDLYVNPNDTGMSKVVYSALDIESGTYVYINQLDFNFAYTTSEASNNYFINNKGVCKNLQFTGLNRKVYELEFWMTGGEIINSVSYNGVVYKVESLYYQGDGEYDAHINIE